MWVTANGDLPVRTMIASITTTKQDNDNCETNCLTEEKTVTETEIRSSYGGDNVGVSLLGSGILWFCR